MRIYRIEHEGAQHFFAVQEDAMKAARDLATESYDGVAVEALEPQSWPLTKRTFVDILNGEDWTGEPEVIYTAKAGLTGKRPEPPAEPDDETDPESAEPAEPDGAPSSRLACEPLHPESVVIINPEAV